MCGIVGGIHTRISRQGMDYMLQKIAHRGPDDQGLFVHENCWLGNTRLAVQDLSQRGHQPMQSADGRYTIVYNGELYNHHEIRSSLTKEGIIFRSEADTETLLQAFIYYGKSCLEKLNGIFAFAIYDSLSNTVFLARDPMGVKPFYYYQDEHHFLFSSELKALAHLQELDYSIDSTALSSYIRLLYSPGTATPFRKVKKLLPGHFMDYRDGIISEPTCYYRIPFDGQYDRDKTLQQWTNELDLALNKSVSSQLISDAPVGFFLSGGLDSSLVAALAAKNPAQQPLTCFTINTQKGFRNEGFEDDTTYARMAAKQLKATLIEVDGRLNIKDDFDKMIYHLDEPQADPAALYVGHIAKAAKAKGIKVLLGGTGADDVFSGYRRHQALYFERLVASYPKWLHKPTASMLQSLGKANTARRFSKIFAVNNSTVQQRIDRYFWLANNTVNSLFIDRGKDANPYHYFETLLKEIPDEHSSLNQMLYWEMRSFLPDHNLNYTDKMSMAEGIETRVPFLDKDLIALSARMPPNLKMKGLQTKYVLREVAKKYLPKEIINRKKTGFGAPLRSMIKGELNGMVKERLLTGSLERWNIFNVKAMEQLVDDNARGKVDAAYPIFALMAIESWLRQFAAK